MLRLVERLSLFPYTTLFRSPPRVRRSALITALSTSAGCRQGCGVPSSKCGSCASRSGRSEEHTSELQSRGHIVCRLLLEKKKLRQIGRTHFCTPVTWLCCMQ